MPTFHPFWKTLNQSYARWSSDFNSKGLSLKNQNLENKWKLVPMAKFDPLATFSDCIVFSSLDTIKNVTSLRS